MGPSHATPKDNVSPCFAHKGVRKPPVLLGWHVSRVYVKFHEGISRYPILLTRSIPKLNHGVSGGVSKHS